MSQIRTDPCQWMLDNEKILDNWHKNGWFNSINTWLNGGHGQESIAIIIHNDEDKDVNKDTNQKQEDQL